MSSENDTRRELAKGCDDIRLATNELDVEELRARLDERDREVEELRGQLAEFQEQRRQAGRLALAGGSFTAKVAAGRELTRAVKRWLEAKTLTDPLPVDETADVAAAIVRRWLRVGLWHVALASGGVITAGILIWQGFLIRGQIEEQQAQNELIQAQNEQQQKDTLIVRRAQLLDTIYTQECEDPPATDASDSDEPQGRSSEGRTSKGRPSAGRTSKGWTSAKRTSARQTSARQTSAERTSTG